jgi:hypothetical protein
MCGCGCVRGILSLEGTVCALGAGLSCSFLGFGTIAAWICEGMRGVENQDGMRDGVVAAKVAVRW